MKDVFKIVFIGSGVSTAVPNLNHILNGSNEPCPVCTDAMNPESKNRRNNVSIAVIFDSPTTDGGTDRTEKCVLVDVGKTMRDSCLRILPRHGVTEINAIFLTHGHADAVLGLDDVRDLQRSKPVSIPNPNALVLPKTSPVDCQCCQPPGPTVDFSLLCQVCGGDKSEGKEEKASEAKQNIDPPMITGFEILSGAMPIYLHQETMDVIKRQFGYLTSPPEYLDELKGVLARRVALLQFTVIEQNSNINIQGLKVRSVPVWHGGEYVSLGFAIGDAGEFVYISDVKIIPEPTMLYLRSLPQINTLVLDALNRGGIWPHMGLDEALAVVADLKPKCAYFTGMACDMGFHEVVEAELAERAPHTHLAFDGLVLDGFKMGSHA